MVVSLPGHTSYAQFAEVKSRQGDAEVKATLRPALACPPSAKETAVRAGSPRPPSTARRCPGDRGHRGYRLDARYLVLAATVPGQEGPPRRPETQVSDCATQARLRGVGSTCPAERDQGPAATAEKVRGFINGSMASRIMKHQL